MRDAAVTSMFGHKTESKYTHHRHRRVQAGGGGQRRVRTTFCHNGPLTTKVNMVPTVPQVRMKLASFGEETLVCSEPRVINVV